MKDHRKDSPDEPEAVSRRKFLLNATVGTAAGFAGAVPFAVAQSSMVEANWDREADIIVVGSGAAASVAAISAAHAGSSVIIIEKASIYGGTTARSAGGFWIPNHRIMRERGENDPREDALRYMARSAYPNLYRPEEPRLGLPE
ncbi:MAG: FAD-dependent oxidoreductase, partial [Proteobacteria bacterium]|nr:FAD-dependent oxidoreductase [Pseudomonadota bacterium]